MSHPDESPHKRQRISQACETCRKRKSKCDGAHPICSICVSHDRVCTYDNGCRKRGLQSGYVRSMETILGILVQEMPDVENKLRRLLRSPEIGRQFVSSTYVDTVTSLWHQSNLHEDLKRLLGRGEDGIEALSPIPSQQETVEEPVLLFTTLLTPPSLAPPLQECTEVTTSSDDTNGTILVEAAELIDLYFIHVHPLFPIVERLDILHTLHANNPSTKGGVAGDGHYTCMLSISALMLTLQRKQPSPNPKVEQLLNQVQANILGVSQDLAVGHVQAAILLALTKLTCGQVDSAWIWLGQISRMMIICTNMPSLAFNRLPHMLQAFRILDVLVSTFLGRSCYPWSGESPQASVDEDGIDEWDGWHDPKQTSTGYGRCTRTPLRALSIFNHIGELMLRLQRFLSTPTDQDRCQVEIDKLQQWWLTLPSYCKPRNEEIRTPCVLNLQLFYNFVSSILYKTLHNTASISSIAIDAANATLDVWQGYVVDSCYPQVLFGTFVRHNIEFLEAVNATVSDTAVNALTHELQQVERNLRCFQTSKTLATDLRERRGTDTVDLSTSLLNPIVATRNTFDHVLDPQGQQSTAPFLGIVTPNPAATINLMDFQMDLMQSSSGFAANSATTYQDNEFDALFETDFEAILDDIPLQSTSDKSTSAPEFFQNLGFITGDMDPGIFALMGLEDYPT